MLTCLSSQVQSKQTYRMPCISAKPEDVACSCGCFDAVPTIAFLFQILQSNSTTLVYSVVTLGPLLIPTTESSFSARLVWTINM